MRKIAILCLIFVLFGGLAFSQCHLQAGLGILYIPTGTDTEGAQSIASYRAGVTGDILFSVGTFELGAEVGFYGLPLYIIIATVFVSEIPIDALVRLNITPDRTLALEFRGGIWITNVSAETVWGESASLSDTRYHFGGRILLSWFYVGCDYIAQSAFYPAVATFEIGLKFTATFPTSPSKGR